MKVSFRTLKNEEVSFEIEQSDSIVEVKKKVETHLSNMPASKQLLIHAGSVLSDEKSVEDYSIKENDRLVVMVSQRTTPKAPAEAPNDSSNTTTAPESPKAVEAQTAKTPLTPPSTATVHDVPSASTDVDTANAAGETETGASLGGATGAIDVEETIAHIVSMGFPRSDVERALQAAFLNPDRAVEYLMTGIPEGILTDRGEDLPAATPDRSAPPAVTHHTAGAESQSAFGDGPNTQQQQAATGGALDALRQHPMFERMRQTIQANPNLLPQMIQLITQQNPRLAGVILQNEDEFLRMLAEPAAVVAGGAMANAPMANTEGVVGGGATTELHLNEQEVEAVKRLEDLGFPRALVLQAYFACEKNEEIAANYLFDNISDLTYADEETILSEEDEGTDAAPGNQ